MHCSHKTPIARASESDEDVRRAVWGAMQGLVASLPARMKREVTDEMMENSVRAGRLRDGDRQAGRATHVRGAPTHADVAAVKNAFRGLIVSEIDKERGELAAL